MMKAKLKVVANYVDAVEPLATWRPDAEPMLVEHWRELATYPEIPLEPHWPWYERADQLGTLRIYTTRYEGALVAYALFVVIPIHPHYASIGWATNDIVWVDPRARGKGIATGLFDFFEADLKEWFKKNTKSGTGIVQARSKTKSPELAKMLLTRGYRSDEQGHTKRL